MASRVSFLALQGVATASAAMLENYDAETGACFDARLRLLANVTLNTVSATAATMTVSTGQLPSTMSSALVPVLVSRTVKAVVLVAL